MRLYLPFDGRNVYTLSSEISTHVSGKATDEDVKTESEERQARAPSIKVYILRLKDKTMLRNLEPSLLRTALPLK